jgi:hypothetical protein
MPSPSRWRDELTDAAGVLVVGNPAFAPRDALAGLFVRDSAGRRVPAGWLPANAGLARHVEAAAEVARRCAAMNPLGPVALLAQFDDRALRLSRRTARLLGSEVVRRACRSGRVHAAIPTFLWSADRIVRNDMLSALATGPGLALYVGHGRTAGWLGYHGVRSHHLARARGAPIGAVVSITCMAASRCPLIGPLSFAEAIIFEGIAAASVGAVVPTEHGRNQQWTRGLCRALLEGAETLGEALGLAVPDEPGIDADYRIIGDPLAGLRGHHLALVRGTEVYAPAATDPLCDA